jgi:CRP-like cAMP-binding protein
VVCRVEREDLEELVRRNPEVGLGLARMLATQLMLMEDRWADAVEKEVSERLAGLLYMLVESEGVMTPEGPMIPACCVTTPARTVLYAPAMNPG